MHAKRSIQVLIVMAALLMGSVSASRAQSSADLIVHFVEGTPRPEEFNYAVSVYFSAYRAGGEPLRDLHLGQVAITEDGHPVELNELALAEGPIQVVLVMDTSGSMSGLKMSAAQQAAMRFIEGLREGDRAALLHFDSTVRTRIGLTDALQEVREQVKQIEAISGAGTCLYDALHEAIILSASIPSGRRAVVVLTDGIDELPGGGRCSRTTEEEVLSLAQSGLTRVPLYTIGLGNRVDQNALNRLAERTGGRYRFAFDERTLDDLFQSLLEHLQSQYRAVYFSNASPGPHQVVVEVQVDEQPVRELREFTLPPFPYVVRFVAPEAGQIIREAVTLRVEVVGQGVPVERVEFFAGENHLGSDSQPPYEYLWQPEAGLNAELVVRAVAVDADGKELTQQKMTVQVEMPPAEEPASTEESVSPEEPPPTAEMSQPQASSWISMLVPLGLAGTGVLLVLVAGFAVVAWRTKKRKQQEEERREREWREKVILGTPLQAVNENEATFDALAVPGMASLCVVKSDDASLIGTRFELKKASMLLGRKSDCDFVFPNDKPVSRHHARIENAGGVFYLSEVISLEADGSRKRPVYGTFVNDQQVEGHVRLKDGDHLRLGKRLVLRFNALATGTDNERTIDQLDGGTLDDIKRGPKVSPFWRP